jgi:hypothetical protein
MLRFAQHDRTELGISFVPLRGQKKGIFRLLVICGQMWDKPW